MVTAKENGRLRKKSLFFESMSGVEKAATLLITLGSDACAKVFQVLSQDEVEELASEIARMQNVRPNVISSVIQEFNGMVSAELGSTKGGIEYATEVIKKALGPTASADTLERITAGSRPFDLLTASPSATELLLEMIREEHPQTIALILVHIKEQRAAEALSALPPALRSEVVTRIANMTDVSPEVISQIEEALHAKSHGQERIKAGGIKTAAEILNRVSADVEKQIMESIVEFDPELAQEISDHMFTYEDIVTITDTGLQLLIQTVLESDLVMALKASPESIRTKFLSNMSQRKRQTIQEDLDNIPPVRLKDAQAAQKRILNLTKELIQSGKIEIIRDTEQEVFV